MTHRNASISIWILHYVIVYYQLIDNVVHQTCFVSFRAEWFLKGDCIYLGEFNK